MPDGGTVRIETTNVDLAESPAAAIGVPSGRYVTLSVTDTGCGMDEQTKTRIFEPFFTTKDLGKGTGLGLATVFAIMSQFRGGIEVESEPARGSTIRLYFPYVEATIVEPLLRVHTRAATGTETVLLVEDNPQLRAVALRMIRSWGYSCIDMPDSASALSWLERGDRIDLLLTDIGLPGLDGRAFAAKVRELQPGVKVLLMSGYTEHHTIKTAPQPDEPLLPKPFTAATLSTAIREAIGSSTACNVDARGRCLPKSLSSM
jgi:CheY-like chemotaxis protein